MKLLKGLINTIMFLLLLILILSAMFIICSKTLISKKNIANFISKANVLNFDINILFNQEPPGITLKEKVITLGIENNIPKEIIDDILKSDEVNEWLADFFNQVINYVINGGSEPKISIDTIEDMKKIANESLNNHINIMIEEQQMDKYIEKYCQSIVALTPKRQNTIINIPVPILEKIINFNIWYLYTIIVLVLIFISVINKKWYKFIKYLGLTMLISGIMFVIIGSLEYAINNLVLNEIVSLKPFITPLITNVLTIWFKGGVLASFSSVVIVLIYMTINKIYNN